MRPRFGTESIRLVSVALLTNVADGCKGDASDNCQQEAKPQEDRTAGDGAMEERETPHEEGGSRRKRARQQLPSCGEKVTVSTADPFMQPKLIYAVQ